MNKIITIIIAIVICILIVGGAIYFVSNLERKELPNSNTVEGTEPKEEYKNVDFSKVNQEFLFSAKVPVELEVEYIPSKKAINIYNPRLDGNDTLQKSQIYVSFFRANSFLTLNTVNITRQDKSVVSERDAIIYEITKKNTANNFFGQPDWRNFKHTAVDVRFSEDNPTYFYSFAQNPNFSDDDFDDFINSLMFYQEK